MCIIGRCGNYTSEKHKVYVIALLERRCFDERVDVSTTGTTYFFADAKDFVEHTR